MKKIVVIFFVIVCMFFSGLVYGIQNITKVLVNGIEEDVETRIINGNIYVNALSIPGKLGGKVNWDKNSNTLSISTSTNDIIIPETIKAISPCVVGVAGNQKDNDDVTYAKYSEQIIHGTGVIIKSNGEILTNAHVVKYMEKIVVVLADGSGYEAKLKYFDEDTDLAVVKIDKTRLPVVKFGNMDDIITGKTVIAIGTPISLSLRNSAAIGIISGINRSMGSAYRLIQTDAAINPGNSGGPLVNLDGKVIGINTSKYMGTGIEGMGFSIPVDTINYVLNQFDKFGKIKRPFLGSIFEEDWAAKVGLPTNSGLLIKSIQKNSPAQKYGLRVDDTLLSINKTKINTIVDFNEEMKKYLPQDKVEVGISRDKEIKALNVVLGEK